MRVRVRVCMRVSVYRLPRRIHSDLRPFIRYSQVHVYIYIYVLLSIYVCTHMYVYIYTYLHTDVQVCMLVVCVVG